MPITKKNFGGLLLVIALSGLLILTLISFKSRKKGSTNCKPENKIIYVAPDSSISGCSDLQAAVDNLNSTDSFTIKLLPGKHILKTKGDFALFIKNKILQIVGDDQKGTKATQIIFPEGSGGIWAEHSSISIEWLEILSSGASSTIAVQNSDNLKIGQIILENSRGNALQIDHVRDTAILNSDIKSSIVGIAGENLNNVKIEGNKISSGKVGIALALSQANIISNLIFNAQNEALRLSNLLESQISKNTLDKNNIAIFIENTLQQINITKNIISDNQLAFQNEGKESDNITAIQNDLWNNSTNFVNLKENNNIFINPLFGDGYCLHKDSEVLDFGFERFGRKICSGAQI